MPVKTVVWCLLWLWRRCVKWQNDPVDFFLMWAMGAFMQRWQNEKNNPYSDLWEGSCIISRWLTLVLVVTPDKKLKLATFVASVAVIIGFYFDVTASCGAFAAVLPTVCWHVLLVLFTKREISSSVSEIPDTSHSELQGRGWREQFSPLGCS